RPVPATEIRPRCCVPWQFASNPPRRLRGVCGPMYRRDASRATPCAAWLPLALRASLTRPKIALGRIRTGATMAGLYDVLASAQNGEAIDRLARQFGLSPQQAEEAVAALLPAISRDLKQSTETPEGLAGLIGMMAGETALPGLYDD